MKNLTTILLLLGSMFMLSNCKDDCADKKTPLKDLHLYVPYTGTETLRFLHNSTDTQFFIGQGMERFYVTEAQKDDYDCPEDHESVRIRFVNPKTLDEIKMEYVYDKTDFSEASSFYQNEFIYYKFYFNSIRYGSKLIKSDLQFSNIHANKIWYNYINLFYYAANNRYYFAYRRPVDGNYSGIIKVNTPKDTLEVIQK